MDQLVRTSARALCFAVFLATAGCGGQAATPLSPVAPSPVVAAMPNFAGEWTVTYHVDECIGRYCYITHVNRDTQFTLRLIQSGDRVTGAFLSDGLVADVEGRIDAAGRLSLAGSAAAPIPDRGSLELLRFDAALDDGRGLQGAVHYQSLVPGERSAYSTGATGPIVTATRRPLTIDTFSGTWRGYFNTTSCSSASGCLLDAWSDLDLELDDRGGQIAGTLRLFSFVRVPLAGSVAGDAAVLRGTQDGLAEYTVRIRRTPTGRLAGSVAVTSTWSAELELLSMALAPDQP